MNQCGEIGRKSAKNCNFEVLIGENIKNFWLMRLKKLLLINFKNLRQSEIELVDGVNCFVGDNGMGKTNLLDAIYYMSFCKSSFVTSDAYNLKHGEPFFMLQGQYVIEGEPEKVLCSYKAGARKRLSVNDKEYKRFSDHVGRIPLVMISPSDSLLVSGGSEERRRFMDVVISQYDINYLNALIRYDKALKQRNALLKQYEDHPLQAPTELFEVLELQMAELATYIYQQRTEFIMRFTPAFQEMYSAISGDSEQVSLLYTSQLQNRNLIESFAQTRQRDLIVGWTTQGIHKDELEMQLGDYPIKRVGSQGQQKSFLLAMKLGQAIFLGKPILLLDDIFDKLDSERVERIIRLVSSDRFGQIFITDTDRQHLTTMLDTQSHLASVFQVSNGQFYTL